MEMSPVAPRPGDVAGKPIDNQCWDALLFFLGWALKNIVVYENGYCNFCGTPEKEEHKKSCKYRKACKLISTS